MEYILCLAFVMLASEEKNRITIDKIKQGTRGATCPDSNNECLTTGQFLAS
jgi:hypothetical protein